MVKLGLRIIYVLKPFHRLFSFILFAFAPRKRELWPF